MIDLNILQDEPAEVYHGKAAQYLSSHQLLTFMRCPYLYAKKRAGLVQDTDSASYFLGRAAHTRILEGQPVYEREYAIGGPINPATGKPYGSTTKKFLEWQDIQKKPVIPFEKAETIEAMNVVYDVLHDTLQQVWESDQYMLCAAFHPTDSMLACCDKTRMAMIDLKTNRPVFEISFEYGFVPGMAFSTDGDVLYIVHSFFSEDYPAGWDRTRDGPYCVSEIIKVDTVSQTVTEKLPLQNTIVEATDFLISHNLAAIRFMGGEAEIWDMSSERCIQTVSHGRGSRTITFIDEQGFLTDGSPTTLPPPTENVVRWDLKTGNKVDSFHPHNMGLSGMKMVVDKSGERLVLSGGQDRLACLWNLKTGKVSWSKRFQMEVHVGASKDGRKAVILSRGDPLLLEF